MDATPVATHALTLAEVGDAFKAVGNAIVDGAIEGGKWIGRNWTNYVVPALACCLAIINTGFGLGAIAIIIGTIALAASNIKKFQGTMLNGNNKDEYKWVRVSLQLVAAVSFLAAGGLIFRGGSAAIF